jgi:hypothetical protein
VLQNVRAAAAKTKCTTEFVLRSPSSFVSLLNHLVTTQHVPWEPSWSVKFGSTNKVKRPYCFYIRGDGSFTCMTYKHGCIVRHLSPLWGKTVCLKMGPAWQVWVSRSPPARWTGYPLSAELYRKVKQPRWRWIGPLNQIHWLWRPSTCDMLWRMLLAWTASGVRRSLRIKQGDALCGDHIRSSVT